MKLKVLLLLLPLLTVLPAPAGEGALAFAKAIRHLPRQEALAGRPVCVTGIVTSVSAPGTFVLDDGAVGVRCHFVKNTAVTHAAGAPAAVQVGAAIIAGGTTDFGAYAPIVRVSRLRITGTSPLPPPKAASLEELFSGVMDAQRVSTEGIVRHARLRINGTLVLQVGTRFEQFRVTVPRAAPTRPEAWEDARIRATGCMVPIFNPSRELISVEIQANSLADIETLTPAPGDPFAIGPTDIADLRGFAADGATLHRRKVVGTVTFSRPPEPFLFLRQKDGRNLRASLAGRNTFQPGDQVEAVGFVNFKSTTTRFEDALVRKVGSDPAAVPPFRKVTLRELLNSPSPAARAAKDWFGELVTVEGTVLDINRRETFLQLALGQHGNAVSVAIPFRPNLKIPDTLQVGTGVRVSGAVSVNYQLWPSDEAKSLDMTINLASIDDLKILTEAPFWTTLRVTILICVMLVLASLALLWISILRRAVSKQTLRLEESIRMQHNAELEFEATKRERLRLSHDLHDGFQQLLAGSMYRIKAALNYLPPGATEAREQLASAQESLMHTQTGLRATLWGLTEESEGPADLCGLFVFAAKRLAHWQGIVKISHTGAEPPMPRHLVGSLLMILQEGVGNAIRHGQATDVQVHLDFDEAGLTLTISDNGCGFDMSAPETRRASHLGINGMRERMRWLGGTFGINSHPGCGTVITVHIEWKKVPPATEPIQ